MSNIYKHKRSLSDNKVISIKPIRRKNSNTGVSEKKDEELETEAKLDEAYQELKNTKSQAQEILAVANQQIEQQKLNWEKEKQDYIRQAQERGYQDGFETGEEASLVEYRELINQAKSVIDSAKKDYHTKIQQSEETILELGVRSASKILNYELEKKPDKFIHLVKSAINEVKDQITFKVCVHPNDYEQVLNQKDELMTIVDAKADLSIYPDESLDTGSCVIESPFGRIDASIQSQLLELRNKLHDLAQEESSGY